MRNWFTFGDIDSRDFGVYISGGGTFNSPQRLYDTIKVPGRDGNLLSTENSLDDVKLTYPAFIYRDFKENIAGLRAALLGKIGYQRLTDTYHTDEYREAYFAGAIDVDTTPVNDAGQFDITFVCHPQRYLISGETPIVLTEGSVSHTASGNPVIIDNSEDLYTVKDLTLTLTPSQDLNGYDYAWAGGNGKNQFNYNGVGSLDSLSNNNGTFTNTTTDTRTIFVLTVQQYNGTNYIKGDTLTISKSGRHSIPITIDTEITKLRIKHNGGKKDFIIDYPFTEQGAYCLSLTVISANPTVVGGLVFKDIMLEIGSTATEYEPYENICPISGAESVTVKRTGRNIIDNNLGSQTSSGVTFTQNADGSITIDGTATATFGFSLFENGRALNLLPNKTYHMRLFDGDGNVQIQIYVNDIYRANTAGNEIVYTVPPDAERSYARIRVGAGQTFNNLTVKPVISYEPITEWSEPATAESLSVSLGQTVYGGTVDIISGTLTIDRQIFRVGDMSWSRSGDTFRYSNTQLTGAAGTSLSDTFRYNPYSATMVDGDFLVYGGSVLVVKMSTPTTASAFRSAYGDAKFCLQIRNQTVVQLTPHQIDLLTGHNVLTGSHELSVIYFEPVDLVNPTPMAAKPLMNVTGHGTLIVNGCYFEISDTYGNIDIDFDLMDATHDGQNANSEIAVSDLDFPVLHGGTNKILFDDTITKLTITPKWWRP